MHSRAVCSDLVHYVANVAAIEAHCQNGVGAFGCSGLPQTLQGVFATVGKQRRVTFDLTANDSAQARAKITKDISASHDKAKHFAIHRVNAITRQVVGSCNDHVFHIPPSVYEAKLVGAAGLEPATKRL